MRQQTISILMAIVLASAYCNVTATAQISESKLLASDGGYSDLFGYSVSAYGDYALISALWDDDNGENAGAVYVFHHDGTNWVEQSKLIASDGEEGDYFGHSVSLYGDNAIIGTPRDDDNSTNSGSAYIFHYDGSSWIEQAKLVAGDGALADEFGSTVSIWGDYALVAANGYNGANAGSVYVFHYDGSSWIEQARLVPGNSTTSYLYGNSVSLSEDYAIVGDMADALWTGSAYVFHYDGANWVEQAKLLASDGEASEYFGCSVSLSGDHAIIGAPQGLAAIRGLELTPHAMTENRSTGHEALGSAYVFHYDGTNWVEQARLIASDAGGNDNFGGEVSLSDDYALIGAHSDGAASGSAYIFHKEGSSWVEQTKLEASDFEAGDNFGRSLSLSGDFGFVTARLDDDLGYASGSAYVYSATAVCSKVSQFQARCRPGGLIKARVFMADASHAGDIVEISIDDVPYEVTIDATGRGQLSQGGFSSGPHTVELTNPGQCFDPIVVTCRTGLDEEVSGDWDDELISESPTETALLGNYPNPFNPSTTIRYTLSGDSPVSIRVYNMLGQEVATLVDGFQKAGEQSVTWHGVNNFGQAVASGLYIYRLQAGNRTLSQKMLLAK